MKKLKDIDDYTLSEWVLKIFLTIMLIVSIAILCYIPKIFTQMKEPKYYISYRTNLIFRDSTNADKIEWLDNGTLHYWNNESEYYISGDSHIKVRINPTYKG